MNSTDQIIIYPPLLPKGTGEINKYRARIPFTVAFQIPTLIQIEGFWTLSGKIQIIEPRSSLPARIFDFFCKKLKGKTENKDTGLSKKIDENLILAKKIIAFVNEHILISLNYPNRQYARVTTSSHLTTITEYVRENLHLESIAKRAMKYNVGNCAEMAYVGLFCPEIVKGSIRVEVFRITKPGDHVFLVIGRDQNTKPDDPSTWNPDAVICDPWTQAYYPTSLYRVLAIDFYDVIDDPALQKEGKNPLRPIVGAPRNRLEIIPIPEHRFIV